MAANPEASFPRESENRASVASTIPASLAIDVDDAAANP
jgi:hypothetical protein